MNSFEIFRISESGIRNQLKPNPLYFIQLYGSVEDNVERTAHLQIYFSAAIRMLVPAPGYWKMKILFLLLFLTLPPALPSNASLQDAIGLYEKGKFSQAANVFQQLSASAPSNAEVWVWLSKSRLKTRDWDKAVRGPGKGCAVAACKCRVSSFARPCVRLPGIAFKFFNGHRLGSPGREGIRNREKAGT